MSIYLGNNLLAGTPDITGKANTSLNNLDSTGKNISNWSINVTNCITKIPQDIKLTLSSGTLTLKAGSKVYVPNGSGVFNEVTVTIDKSWGVITYTSGKIFIFYNTQNDNLFALNDYACFSGSSAPSGYANMVWYDTSNNKIKWTSNSGGSWNEGLSLPVTNSPYTNGIGFTSIDQVFNGFGYIGSTVFALPGVKGLIPNGRNDDGTLKNMVIELDSVLAKTSSYTYTTNIGITSTKELSFIGVNDLTYKEKENKNYYNNSLSLQVVVGRCKLGSPITEFSTKTAFHASDYCDTVKYSDKEQVVRWGVPDLTAAVQTAANTDYTTPSNGFISMHWHVGTNNIYINDVVAFQYIMSYNTEFYGVVLVPVIKGTKIKATTSTIEFYPCLGG